MSIIQEVRKQWLTTVGKTLWYGAEHGLYPEIDISDESLENTLQFKAHLDHGGSGLVETNHIASDDIALELAYLVSKLGLSIDELTVPVSKKQYDGREGWFNGLILRILPGLGINRPLLVQSYDRASYDPNFVSNLRDNAFNKVNKTLLTPGGVVEFSPEGRRGKDKTLGRAQTGIGHIVLNYLTDINTQLGMAPEAMLMPAALIPKDRYNRSMNWRFSSHPVDGFEIKVGQMLPLSAIDPSARPRDIAQGCMHYLSAMMPPEMRGRYAV